MCSCSMHSCADPGKYDLWWHKRDQGTGGRDISQHGKIQQREKRDAALWRNQETGEPKMHDGSYLYHIKSSYITFKPVHKCVCKVESRSGGSYLYHIKSSYVTFKPVHKCVCKVESRSGGSYLYHIKSW